MNIIDLIKDKQMNQPTEPTPTENAQIMVMFDNGGGSNVIYRFNNAKKGRKVYDAMVKAWRARREYVYEPKKKHPVQYFEIVGDMFDGCVDLDRAVNISFVEWPKRGKFVPRML